MTQSELLADRRIAQAHGFTLWFTGLSGGGKAALAAAVSSELRGRGIPVEVLDGDEVRQNLSKGLGFSREDRDTNIRRIGYVAKLLARNGVAVITAAISPYRAIRDELREEIGAFVEVYVKAWLGESIRRDTKGLYRRALAGEIPQFTGVSDPYEEPLAPELVIDTEREEVADSASRVIDRLLELGHLRSPGDAWHRAGSRAGPSPTGCRSGNDPHVGGGHVPGQGDPDRELRRGRRRARTSAQPHRPDGAGDLSRHRLPFPRDVRVQGGVHQTLRPQCRRLEAPDRPGSAVPDGPGPLLRDSQGRTPRPGDRRVRCLDQRGATGSVVQPLVDGGRRVSRDRRPADRESVSASALESGGRVALHPGKRRAVSPIARPGLLEHRLLAVHPTHGTRRSRARWAVERHRQDRVRAPHLHHQAGGLSGEL